VAAIVRVASRAELKDRGRSETRYYVSSAALSAARAAEAVRSHWAIENSLHWVLDVTFGDDQSRLQTGHGAKNMAVVRHFAVNLVRAAKDKRSIKLRRKRAGWNPDFLATILGHLPR
jgi:predicted transposase YbfD/YdcC